MPSIRSSISKRRTRVALKILSLGEIMPTYSRYSEKKLVYIIIVSPSGRQPSSYTKYTKVNIRSSYNVRSVLRDTPVTPPTRPPISTDLVSRDRLRD